jgi:hypothetical protein
MWQVFGLTAYDLDVLVSLAQQLRERRVDLNGNVMASPAEAMLDHAGACSGARAELDHHRFAAFGYHPA